ncbi:MAG TPA: LacI family DNA-binding transcriptional regulator [Candidatus Limnocylindrales bacterium]|jgi:LacI family transcriptional regulator|nr:LacI family DNA-binding transcriptional regulator [Candidatus Limnocylindrales bacterium]
MATTIADVARRAQVSTATVSRVLGGLGRASPATRDRVLAAASDLDYRPSAVARSLKRQSTETLGLIVTDIENPYFPELVRAVEDAARAEGYTILLCNASDDPEREAGYLDLLVERRVDGLIVAAGSLGVRHRDWLRAAPLPVVLVNTSTHDVDLPSIRSDDRGGSRLAARHLLDLGHRRFGYLLPPPRNVDGPVRMAGVRDALAEAGLDPDGLVVVHGSALVGGGETAMLELLDRAPGTTAVLAYNDLMAIGAMRAIRGRGLAVPRDMSLIGFDDVSFAAYVDPPLTTLSQSTTEMGHWAVDQLATRLRGGADGADLDATPIRAPVVTLPVQLQVRGTTGPVRRT